MADIRPSNVDKKSADGEIDVMLCNYTDVYYNHSITADMSFMSASAPSSQVERFELRQDDVLVTKDSESAADIAVSAHVHDDLPGVLCGYHLAILRPLRHVSGRFLAYALRSKPLAGQTEVAASGITRFALGTGALSNLSLPLPNPEQQLAIADFLDRETEKIDALVSRKQRLVELLQEKRAALISHVVTKGLDAGKPTRDSGVDIIATIPCLWTVQRLRTLSPALGVGVVVNPSDYISEEGVPFLYGSDVSPFHIDVSRARRMTAEDSRHLVQSMLHEDDLVTVRVGDPGVTAVIPGALEGANCASMMIVRRSPTFDSQWLCYAMNSRLGRSQVEMVQYGAAQKQFNISHAVDFRYPVPPLMEQKAIVRFLDTGLGEVIHLESTAGRGTAVMSEYRSALITAAVTGQIDVRTYRRDPEEVLEAS